MSQNFEFMSKVGEGAFATVYKVKRKQDSNIYAFKKMKVFKAHDRETSNFLNEIRILASINNPYIVGFKQAFYDQNLKSVCLITQFAEGGDLSSKINRARKSKEMLNENYIWKTVLQLLHGIKALHGMNVFHRDIKPANILLTKNQEQAKLADMNVSVVTKNGMAMTQTGTPYYSSPEVWLERPYNGKSDIWSLGCVVYEMATLRTPFTAPDLPSLRRRIIENQFQPISSFYSKQLQAFIRLCLQKDQKRRPNVKELLNLPLIKEKIRSFPLQKFNQVHLPGIEKNPSMIQTIKIGNGNLRGLQSRLPKCNYDSADKENYPMEPRLQKNQSCVAKLAEKQKLPAIKRPGSSCKIAQLPVPRREVLKKLR